MGRGHGGGAAAGLHGQLLWPLAGLELGGRVQVQASPGQSLERRAGIPSEKSGYETALAEFKSTSEIGDGPGRQRRWPPVVAGNDDGAETSACRRIRRTSGPKKSWIATRSTSWSSNANGSRTCALVSGWNRGKNQGNESVDSAAGAGQAGRRSAAGRGPRRSRRCGAEAAAPAAAESRRQKILDRPAPVG